MVVVVVVVVVLLLVVVVLVVAVVVVVVAVVVISRPQSGHFGSGLVAAAAKVMPRGFCSALVTASASSSSTKMQMPPRRISEDLLENSCSACGCLVFSSWKRFSVSVSVLYFVFFWIEHNFDGLIYKHTQCTYKERHRNREKEREREQYRERERDTYTLVNLSQSCLTFNKGGGAHHTLHMRAMQSI